MADYTYNSLSAKNGGFKVPAAAVKLDGSDVAKEFGCRIQKVAVTLFRQDVSTAEIEIGDCYNIKTQSLDQGLKAKLLLGTKITVEFGYLSNLTGVFSGYLESVSLEMSEEDAYILRLAGMDVIRLLKDNTRCCIWKGTSHSSVVSEILEEYGWICKKSVDSTENLEEEGAWWQKGSDYDFIAGELAGIYNPGYRFYAMGGTVYFSEKKDEKAVLCLEPGDGIGEFHASWHFLNKEVKVHGISENHERYLGTSKAKGPHVSGSAGMGAEFQVIPQAGTKDNADALAAFRGEKIGAEAVDISLGTVGLPQLIPGKYLELSGMDGWVNGTYLIEEAVHEIDENGYRTKIRLGGG